jgi:hypothetical protein
MADGFHRVTLTQKVSDADISILDFEFLDNHYGLSPLSLIDDTVATLANITLNLEFFPIDLEVRVKCTMFGDASDLKLG